MSKARKRFANKGGKQQWIFADCTEPPERPADEVDADVLRAAASAAVELPWEVMRAIHSAAASIGGDWEWNWFKGYTLSQQLEDAVKDEKEFINRLVTDGVERGFRLAVERYAKQLRNVPELATWHRKRQDGGDKGRASQTYARQKRVAQAREMLDAGHNVPEISRRLGCSISTVYRALNMTPRPRGKPTQHRQKR